MYEFICFAINPGRFLCFIVGKTTIVDRMKHIYTYAFYIKCESVYKKQKRASFPTPIDMKTIVVSTLNAI